MQGDDKIKGPGHLYGDDPSPGAPRDQAAGQSIDPLAEFPVRQGRTLEGDGRRVRGGRDPLGDQAGQGGPHDRPVRVVPPVQDGVPLILGEQVDRTDRPVRLGHRGGQQPGEPDGERLHGGPVEQRGPELQPGVHRLPGATVGDAHRQVELGVPGRRDLDGRVQSGQIQGLPQPRPVDQQHLEQRVICQRPRRVQLLDEPVERQVGVIESGHVGLPHPVQQLGEGGIPGGVGAQREGVDEEADQIVEGGVATAGDRGADHDVGAGAEPGEQGGQARVQHHEDAAAGGRGTNPVGQVGGQVEADGGALASGDGRAGPVGGQVDHVGRAGQGVAPERDLGGFGRGEQLPLPEGIVGVRDGQLRPVRGVTVAAGPVGGGQIGHQRFHRPLVAGDVVQQQDQVVGGVVDPAQRGPQRQVAGQVERLADRRGHVAGAPEDRPIVENALAGNAVRAGREDRAQGGVPVGEVTDGGIQGGHVQVAGEPGDQRHVVRGGVRVEAAQEPQALLGVRQGHGFRQVTAGQRGPCRGLLDGGGGDTGRGGRGEQVAQADLPAQVGAEPSDQAGGEK
ncbi:hypothetical protein GCM10009531_53930 [Actinoplanes capillaceus]